MCNERIETRRVARIIHAIAKISGSHEREARNSRWGKKEVSAVSGLKFKSGLTDFHQVGKIYDIIRDTSYYTFFIMMKIVTREHAIFICPAERDLSDRRNTHREWLANG